MNADEARGERDDVEAIVLAAGRGERLGLGPKAFLVLDGRTLLDRAVALMLTVARRVVVGLPEEHVERAAAARSERVTVIAGGATRIETTLRLYAATTAAIVVQHDVVHPFASCALARRVVRAARLAGAAMAVAPSGAHVYRGAARLDERIAPGPGLWLAQKPLAYTRAALDAALATGGTAPKGAGTPDLLLAAGQPIEAVEGDPWNIKITNARDWRLAGAIHRSWSEAGNDLD